VGTEPRRGLVGQRRDRLRYEPTYAVPREELPEAPTDDDGVAEVVQRSADHGDEHVIKFTDTAVEVYARTSNPDALAAAIRIAELIEPRA